MAASQKMYRAMASEVSDCVQAERSMNGHVGMNTVQVVIRMAQVFKVDNPKFRFSTFYRACGLDALVKDCDCADHQFVFASQADWSSEKWEG